MLTQLNLISSGLLCKILISTLDLHVSYTYNSCCFLHRTLLWGGVSKKKKISIKKALTQSRPLHSHSGGNEFEMEEIMLHEHARCVSIMVKAGADLSLVVDGCVTAFTYAIETGSFVKKIVHSQL